MSLRFAPLQLFAFESGDHFHERRVPHVVADPIGCPLHVDERVCKCGQLVDVFGHHRSACSRIGLLKPQGTPAEVCMARICREARARVKESQLFRDLNVIVPADNQRRIEVIANGLPFWGGKQVAIDTTVVSTLTGARCRRQGQAIHEEEQDK